MDIYAPPTMAELATLRRIAADVAAEDPVCYSTEGLDDGCHYCGAWYVSSSKPVEHTEDCTWLAAVALMSDA
jgi:hypothetical protein